MKELVLEIEDLIQRYISTDDESTITVVLDDIDHSLSVLFIEANDSFGTITVNKIILPIKRHVEKIKLSLRARFRTEKTLIERKIQISNKFLLLIFSKYAEKLSNLDCYKNYLVEGKQEQDKILDPFKLVPESLLEYFPCRHYKSIVDSECKNVLEIYKSKMTTNSTGYKDEVFLFAAELTQSIQLHETMVLNLKKDLNRLNSELDNSKGRSFDLVDEIDGIEQRINNLEMFNQGVNDLFLKFKQSFLFLSDLQIEEIAPLTVFGNRDYEMFYCFYGEFKFFVSDLVTFNNVCKAFTLDTLNHSRIELVNGNLNDYGYLILKLKPFFVSELQDGTSYNNWWSSKFVFTASRGARRVEKSPRDISNMISNARNAGDRRPQYLSRIDGIASVFW